ncbi:Alpha/Beta hydrolase protein [Melanogaster broomeanus]|nr:Alpha/Beta hydrolase protein [Melanogaster broomeanus]
MPNKLTKVALHEHLAKIYGGPPNEYHMGLYTKWAKYDWGIVITGNVQVSQGHLTLGRDIVVPVLINEETLAPFKKLARIIHADNSRDPPNCPLAVMQLSHVGRQSPNFIGGRTLGVPPLAPSPVRIVSNKRSRSDDGVTVADVQDTPHPLLRALFQVPREMTLDNIMEVQQAFVRGALTALEAGLMELNCIVHMGTPSLNSSIRRANIRTDQYSAAPENTLRMVREIVGAIRDAVPKDFIVGLKINSADYVEAGERPSDERVLKRTSSTLELDITLTSGTFRGVANTNGTDSWSSIPFAQPSVGSLRFKAPLPITQPLQGIQDASQFGDACLQPLLFSLGANMSENCLVLNVWRPTGTVVDAQLPVMVWFYGGAFMIGFGFHRIVNLSVTMGKPIIFVSVNYRLNTFGFLASADVPPGDLNTGLWDQRAALVFTQENIVQFEGDPSKSAGAGSVEAQILYATEPNLFRAVIADSSTGPFKNAPYDWQYDKPGMPYSRLLAATGPLRAAGARTGPVGSFAPLNEGTTFSETLYNLSLPSSEQTAAFNSWVFKLLVDNWIMFSPSTTSRTEEHGIPATSSSIELSLGTRTICNDPIFGARMSRQPFIGSSPPVMLAVRWETFGLDTADIRRVLASNDSWAHTSSYKRTSAVLRSTRWSSQTDLRMPSDSSPTRPAPRFNPTFIDIHKCGNANVMLSLFRGAVIFAEDTTELMNAEVLPTCIIDRDFDTIEKNSKKRNL